MKLPILQDVLPVVVHAMSAAQLYGLSAALGTTVVHRGLSALETMIITAMSAAIGTVPHRDLPAPKPMACGVVLS